IQRVREALASNGLANKPLWNTETGWLPPANFESDELGAAFLARAFILSWAAGIQRFYWYAWDNQTTAIITYKESARTVTQAGSAYKIMQQWLVGAKMQSCTSPSDHTWTCQLDLSGKKEWIVWNTQGNQKFDLPRSWKAASATQLLQVSRPINGLSVEIGPVPVLFTDR